MNNSDPLKLQAKAVHEAVYGDAKEEKIKQLERVISGLTERIKEIDDAIDYCILYDLPISCMDDAVDQYRERFDNEEYISNQEADQADFDNKLEKEDW